jgi:hypothetical protein
MKVRLIKAVQIFNLDEWHVPGTNFENHNLSRGMGLLVLVGNGLVGILLPKA